MAEQFGAVMLATGRVPNTENMGLEDAQITLKKGAIVVDKYAQTSRKGVYAIGDVTDRVQLTPVAIREAVAFVDTAFPRHPAHYGLRRYSHGGFHPTRDWHGWADRRNRPRPVNRWRSMCRISAR